MLATLFLFSRARILKTFICDTASSPRVLTEFDDKLWMAAIDRATMTLDDTLVFWFRDGTEIVS